jgi:hypothetical protein
MESQAAMSDDKSQPQDLDDMARRYLDLWQEQLGALASNTEAADLMARTIALMNAGAANFAAMATPGGLGKNGKEHDATAAPSDNGPGNGEGSPAPGAAHGASNTNLDQLNERVARLEQRIAELEAGTSD